MDVRCRYAQEQTLETASPDNVAMFINPITSAGFERGKSTEKK
jgi:hypothetical protein